MLFSVFIAKKEAAHTAIRTITAASELNMCGFISRILCKMYEAENGTTINSTTITAGYNAGVSTQESDAANTCAQMNKPIAKQRRMIHRSFTLLDFGNTGKSARIMIGSRAIANTITRIGGDTGIIPDPIG